MIESYRQDELEHPFGPLAVSEPIARSLKAMRYLHPTPVQERSIPVMRTGQDVLAQAQTGTGKTAAFGIPLVEGIRTEKQAVQAIVLVPTRELCQQVADELKQLGATSHVRIVSVYGGVGLGRQIAALRQGAHVVVGTPGRVEDLLGRGNLKLGSVSLAILDEADRMLDVGFLPAIERILARTPSGRQTALFSATIANDVRGLAARHMRQPVAIEIDPERATVDEIEQRFQRVHDGNKVDALKAHLDDPSCYLALVFRRTTHKVDRLARDLSRAGYSVGALHGRRSQNQREQVLAELKRGKLQALVATDIAARGLDIANLTHVFNFDLPDTPETYVHRIGRTGRAGETGTAITLVDSQDDQGLRQLEKYLSGRANDRRAVKHQSPGKSSRRNQSQQSHPRNDGPRPSMTPGDNASPSKDGRHNPVTTGSSRPPARRDAKFPRHSTAADPRAKHSDDHRPFAVVPRRTKGRARYQFRGPQATND